jgi:succinate-semialdehyde dehydrogenase/glutarate-semialdehyde dehydrogenase
LALEPERSGNYFSPGVLTDVSPANAAGKEEFFGPVAMVFRVDSEEEAVRVANQTEFGLGAFVFSTDPEQAMRVASQIESGMVYVNVVDADTAELPFGGVKRSGFGRELGRLGIEEFINRKLIRTG